eukprot:CAMPEP_0183334746 /NCGR_PEP_ID=MMETSP0164_2-20130417/3250_1 /TAXON_ID=221442 /ORGANISM="Coccolithus pelagicus ssp braarudi, Strain PLY182g" /LENGTH=275 /DNA_ID=CAMNT_0025503947 /DNA_START=9 /DNA_END=834 /DNA_ORIENTATION=+
MALISEEVLRLNKRLQDAAAREQAAQREGTQAEEALRAAQQRMKQERKAIVDVLNDLAHKQMSVKALEKSLIGVSVNKLRKHDHAAIASKSEELVAAWKTLVDRESELKGSAQVRGGGGPPVRVPRPTAPSQGRAAVALQAGGRGVVLDMVRDDEGRVERRVADADSHEDMLAVDEARLAEQMWEEKMGTSFKSGISSGAGHSMSPDVSKKASAIAHLRAGYQKHVQEKRKHELVKLDKAPPQQGSEEDLNRAGFDATQRTHHPAQHMSDGIMLG